MTSSLPWSSGFLIIKSKLLRTAQKALHAQFPFPLSSVIHFLVPREPLPMIYFSEPRRASHGFQSLRPFIQSVLHHSTFQSAHFFPSFTHSFIRPSFYQYLRNEYSASTFLGRWTHNLSWLPSLHPSHAQACPVSPRHSVHTCTYHALW